MRTPSIVGAIVGVHCVAIGSVILIQGCGTTRMDPMQEPVMPPRLVVTEPVAPLLIDEPVFAPLETTVYVVKKGDSLSRIAQRHGMTATEIASLNGIKNPNQIRVGQKLVMPGSGDRGSAPAAVQTKPVSRTVQADGPVYTVKTGDSLSVIAVAYGVKVADIKEANGLTGDRIVVGQKLTIPNPSKTPASTGAAQVDAPAKTPAVKDGPASVSGAVQVKPDAPAVKDVKAPVTGRVQMHTVDAGDDLFSIAMMWGVSVSRIREINGLQDDTLTPGQTIKIPLSE